MSILIFIALTMVIWRGTWECFDLKKRYAYERFKLSEDASLKEVR